MRRRMGRRMVDWCPVCMAPAAHCTCGWRGSPAAPGADQGAALFFKRRDEPVEALPSGGFSFETIEEYRDG